MVATVGDIALGRMQTLLTSLENLVDHIDARHVVWESVTSLPQVIEGSRCGVEFADKRMSS